MIAILTRSLSSRERRLGLAAALTFALSPFLAAADRPAVVKTTEFKGKVVPLAALLEKEGVRLDRDAAPHWLALAGDDGKAYPLVKDEGARMFFLDPRLLNRPMRLTGRLVPGTPFLQVVAVYSDVKGELRDVYYWCEVCAIRRHEKRICECCGGPMELHEEPVKK